MRIVLKPLGAIAIIGAIIALALIAFRSSGNRNVVTEKSTASIPTNAANRSSAENPETVYKDGLENGWQERGWAKVIDYKNASPVYGNAGTSIRVEAGPYEAVKIYHPTAVDLSQYKYLVCVVNGGEKGGQPLVVNAIAQGKNQGSVSFPPLPPNKWVRIAVPLSELEVEGRRDFNAFWLQDMSGKASSPFYVDDIQFSATEPSSSTEESLLFNKVRKPQSATPNTP